MRKQKLKKFHWFTKDIYLINSRNHTRSHILGCPVKHSVSSHPSIIGNICITLGNTIQMLLEPLSHCGSGSQHPTSISEIKAI